MRVDINSTVELERRASFTLFDLGALNLLGGVGAVSFHSAFLWSWGFRTSSVLAGLFFIALGLFAGRLFGRHRRIAHWAYAGVLLLHVSESFSALKNYERAFGALLVQLSFVLPSVSALYLLLRSRVTGGGDQRAAAGPSAERRPRALRSLALLSSTLLSVGFGLGLLLAFLVYALPAILNSPNPYVYAYHDFVVVPAVLLCFPLGLALGEGLWLCLARAVTGGKGMADYVRYLSQMPLVGGHILARLRSSLGGGGSAPMIAHRPSHVPAGGVGAVAVASGRKTWGGLLIPGAVVLVLAFIGVAFWLSLPAPKRRSAALPAAPVRVAADALVVSQKGDTPYRTIQSAVDAARPGADVLVRPGVYAESVNISRPVNLVGDTSGGEAVVIECPDGSCLSASARAASAKNFHLRPAAAGFWRRLAGGGDALPVVVISGGDLLLESCVVSGAAGMGVVVWGGETSPTLKGLKVFDTRLNGILFTGGSGGVLEGSEVYETGWAALRVEQGSQPLVLNSKFHHSRMSGIMFTERGAGQVEGCDVYENAYANIDVKERSHPVIRRTRVYGGRQVGALFRGGSSGLIEECDVFDNAYSGVEFAEGSSPVVRRTKIHHGRSAGVYVRGESLGVVEESLVYENRSTGVWVGGRSRPTFKGTVVRANAYSGFEIADGADPLIEGCKIYDGEMSGISVSRGGRGRIAGSDIHSNRMANIALREGARPVISRSKIYDGHQAGVLAVEGGGGTVEQCEIMNNLIGVEITKGGSLVVGGSKITNNRHQGVTVEAGGTGSVSGSDLRRNGRGPWLLGAGAAVDQAGNVE